MTLSNQEVTITIGEPGESDQVLACVHLVQDQLGMPDAESALVFMLGYGFEALAESKMIVPGETPPPPRGIRPNHATDAELDEMGRILHIMGCVPDCAMDPSGWRENAQIIADVLFPKAPAADG